MKMIFFNPIAIVVSFSYILCLSLAIELDDIISLAKNVSHEVNGTDSVEISLFDFNGTHVNLDMNATTNVTSINGTSVNVTESGTSSSWSFLVMADFHGTNSFSFEEDEEITDWEAKSTTLQSIRETYGGELILLPGDVNSYGKLKTEEYSDRLDLPEDQAVYTGAHRCYTKVRQLFGEAGYTTILATPGDHELGGNRGFVTGQHSKLDTIPSLRRAFADGFNSDSTIDEHFIFDEPIGNATSRPMGTPHEGTSFAYHHKNVLFVTVDAFEIVNNGTENFINKNLGTGGEGAVRCTVVGEHLAWFKKVLREGSKDPTIKHIIVQAHLPIAQPVRKVKSSGQFFDRGTESTFWKVMERYNVDLYLAGEVHSNTVIKSSRESNLIQVVSRARAFSGFLKIEITDDSIEVTSYNEIGPKKKWNGLYEEHGNLKITKIMNVTNQTGTTDAMMNVTNLTATADAMVNVTNLTATTDTLVNATNLTATTDVMMNVTDQIVTTYTMIETSGVLEMLDPSSLLLSFDFMRSAPIDERQVLGFQGSDSLVGTNIFIRNKNCTQAMHNKGLYGSQYDAHVANIESVEGAMGYGSYAGVFDDDSIFAVFANGPYGAGQPVSFSFWFKTDVAESDMILVHYGTTYGKSIDAWNTKKDHFTLSLEKGDLKVNLNMNRGVRAQSPLFLADDDWHFVAISMPRHSCYPSELELHVDGISIPTTSFGDDSGIFTTTSGRISLGGFGYSATKYDEAYPTMEPFNGLIGDFSLWARSLEPYEVELPSHEPSMSPSISSRPSSLPSVSPSSVPSAKPSQYPSMVPSVVPSYAPSQYVSGGVVAACTSSLALILGVAFILLQ